MNFTTVLMLSCLTGVGLCLLWVVFYVYVWHLGIILVATVRGVIAGVRTVRKAPSTGAYTGTVSALDQSLALVVTLLGFNLAGLLFALVTPVTLVHGAALGTVLWVLWVARLRVQALRQRP